MWCHVFRVHELRTGWVRSKFKDGVLMEEGPRSLRVAGNGATTLKLIQELNLCEQMLTAAPASKVRYIWYQGKRQIIPSSLFSMLGNPLSVPLLAGVALEPLQNRRHLKCDDTASNAGILAEKHAAHAWYYSRLFYIKSVRNFCFYFLCMSHQMQ